MNLMFIELLLIFKENKLSIKFSYSWHSIYADRRAEFFDLRVKLGIISISFA
jgi:hypothetical protein